MCELTIHLLGTFTAARARTTIDTFQHNKVRALCAYLVTESGRVHTRSQLAALLWPDDDRRHSLRNLSQALYLLRHALGDSHGAGPYLHVTSRTLQWNDRAGASVDIDQVARAHKTLQNLPPGAPIPESIFAAIDCYQGEFLAGFSVDAGEEFDDWLVMARAHFHMLATDILRRLTADAERREKWPQTLELTRRWLSLDMWQEAAHRRAMRALTALGRPDEAVAQYHQCRRLLEVELGVTPSAQTEALFADIVHRQATQSRVRGHCPAPLTPLIGRAQELAQLTAQLTAHDCRLLTLVGPGGCGKTRLAIEVARAVDPLFADGVFFVELAAIDTAAGVPFVVAKALGISLRGAPDVAQQLGNHLRNRRALLVLDNMEHLPDAGGLVVDLLQTAPHVKVFVTSRAKVNVLGEQIFLLQGLPVPAASAPVDTGLQASAVELFLFYARRIRPGYLPTPDDILAIAAVCRALDGMPLALILAAGWMDTLDAPALAAELTGELTGAVDMDDARTLDMLEAPWSDLPARQRSMRTVIDHSWRLLSADEQQALAALAAFRGGFTAASALEVAGINLTQLRGLNDRAFIKRSAPNRFDMHDLLRRYAHERLQRAPARAAGIGSRHSRYFAGYVAARTAALHATIQLDVMAELDREQENIIAAWRHAAAAGDSAVLGDMVDGLCTFLDWRGQVRMGEELCRDSRAHNAVLTPRCARLAIWHAHFLHLLGESARAATILEELLDPIPSVHTGDRARALLELGRVLITTDVRAARRRLQESLALAEAVGDGWAQVEGLTLLAFCHHNLGSYRQGLTLLGQGEAIGRAMGDRRLIAGILSAKSACHGMLGELDAAESTALEGLALCRELGDERSAAENLMMLASKYVYAGHFKAALRIWDEEEEIAHALGDRGIQAESDHFRAWVHVNLGHYALATTLYTRGMRLYEELDHHHGIALSLLGLGEIKLAMGDYENAYTLLSDAEAALHDVGQHDEEALAVGETILALYELGRMDEAWAQLRILLAKDHRHGAFPPAHHAVNCAAVLLAATDRPEQALEYHALAMRHPYLTNSAYREDVVGRHIHTAAARLTDDVRAAAIARGRKRDLLTTIDELRAEFGRAL